MRLKGILAIGEAGVALVVSVFVAYAFFLVGAIALDMAVVPLPSEDDLVERVSIYRLQPRDDAGEQLVAPEKLGATVQERLPGVAVRVEVAAGEVQLVLRGDGARPTPSDAEVVRSVAEAGGYDIAGADFRSRVAGLEQLGLGSWTPAQLAVLLVAQALAFISLGLALRRIRCRDRVPLFGPDRRRLLVRGLAVGVVAVVVGLVIELTHSWMGLPVEEQLWLIELTERPSAELMLVLPLIVVVGPLAEEIFFRGYMFPFLRGYTGVVPAAFVSALYFAGVHFNPSGMVAYLFLGLLFAWSMHRWRSATVPAVAHCFNNLVAMGLLIVF